MSSGSTSVDEAVLRSEAGGAPARARSRLRSDPTVIVVALLTLGTFALRLSQIHQSLFGDEVFTLQDILGKTLPQVVRDVHSGAENSPPLFFMLAYLTAKIGQPSVWIRLPSIVLGALTLPVIYMIGRETVGRAAGMVAAGLVAVSPFAFYYGVEARPYSTMVFCLSISTWALLRAVATRDRRYWALYVVAAVAACYSHYTCVFVLAVQGAWSLWACRGVGGGRWESVRAALISHLAVVVLYIPWLPYLRGKALAVIGYLEPLTAHNVIVDLMRPIVGYPYAPLTAIPTYLGLGLVIACAVVGFGWLARTAPAGERGRRPNGWPQHFWLLVALTLATPVLLLIYSEASTDLWLARNLYASMPAAALVLATVLVAPPRPVSAALVVVVTATLIVGLVRAASPSWRRPPFRAIADYIQSHATRSDPVTAISFIGSFALPAQFTSAHEVVAPGQLFKDIPPGGRGFVVIDRGSLGALQQRRRAPKAPAGFVVTQRLRYRSAVDPGLQMTVYAHASATAR